MSNTEDNSMGKPGAGRRPRWLRFALIGGAVLAALVIWRLWAGGSAEMAGGKGRMNRGAPPPIAVAAAAPADIRVFVDGLGTVTPANTVTVQAQVDGPLMRVAFKEGQIVKAGDLLAEIDPRPFRAQLAQAEGQLAQAQAQLANAELDLKRYKTLVAQDSVARQQLDTQQALVLQDQGIVKTAEGNLANARLQLSYTRITAPINGRVGLRQIDPGNQIRTTDAGGLVVMTQIQPATVVFAVPQDNVPLLMQRMSAHVSLPVEAWDRGGRKLLASGKLIAIDSMIDVTTGTVKLKAKFNNANNALFPNQFVNARLLLNTLHQVVSVPSAAVQHGNNGYYVYVVTPNHTVAVRKIEPGPADENLVAILSGLRVGEKVATDGIDKLRDGMTVKLAGPAAGRSKPVGNHAHRAR